MELIGLDVSILEVNQCFDGSGIDVLKGRLDKSMGQLGEHLSLLTFH